MEKFDDTQLGLDDGYGNIAKNVDPLTGNYINCKGDWTTCVHDDTNNSCKKTYNIENEDYIGSSCAYNTGDIKECIYDKCNEISTYTKNGVEYHIMRGKTLVHSKRDNKNDGLDIQEEIEYTEGDLWNDDKDGDDTNIQLQKLEKIMDEYNDNSDYIGLIKDDVLDGIPKFYPIVLDENSEIEIIEDENSSRRTLYMKKNIDCRGRWEKCEYNQESQRSERYYIIKYPGSGAGNNCAENNNETQTCAEWGSCVTEENPNNYNKPHNIKKWEYKLPNNGCSDINQDCSNTHSSVDHQEWIEEGCVQDNDCGVSWSDCKNIDGLEQKQATINPPATGNGRCAYEDGKWYHNTRVFNADGNIENKICNPLTGDNCICDRDDFPQPCKKKYKLYWGSGDWDSVQKKIDGTIERDIDGIPIPNNRVDDNQPGQCWLHVYDYNEANNKFYERNTGDICPLDDYEYNGEYINIGSRIGTPVSDIGAGDHKITKGAKNYGYKFDIVSTTRECTTENRPHPDIPEDDLDALVANGENLINELDKANQLSDQEQLCNYRDLNNLKNTLNDIVNENQNNNSVNNIIRPLLNVVNTKLSLHSNYQSGTTNDWGEVCRSQGIYPQDCEYNKVETNCNNWRYGYNGKYNVINITKPNKYTGSCDVINGQAINTENCNRILVQDWFSSTLGAVGGMAGNLMSGDFEGAAEDAWDAFSGL
tara:strand:+ start:3387 stop:5498 length:2112 start_codon:yes stop_codon:yes gene_type:complete